jgi:hypothetical protein
MNQPLSIDTQPGKLVCRQCGREWIADDTTAALLEELVAHSATHTENPDEAKPQIWLR